MILEEADKIRLDWGKFLEVSNGQLLRLFLNEIPESLLPYPKKKLEEALKICIEHFETLGEKEAAETFKASNEYLSFYVSDKQALKSASNRFNDPEFLKIYIKK